MGKPLLYCLMAPLLLTPVTAAEPPGLRTQLVRATYRLEHPKGSGTAFIISAPKQNDGEGEQLLLVTTAHGFEVMKGEPPKLVLRKQDDQGKWSAESFELPIRRDGEPLWQKHPKHDVVVMRLPDSLPVPAASIPLNALADADDWQSMQLEPGTLIRSVGFPHAAQYKPSKPAFPLVRIGCIASYPLTPYEAEPIFLVDYNTFEGDSGGPIYVETTDGERPDIKIIGIVFGQHFINERFELVYQSGHIRKRLGVAIAVNSQAVLETIERLP